MELAYDPCDRYVDTDGDTIADSVEGTGNPDGDMMPNYLDLDSDGDYYPDSVEAGDDDLCTPPVDSDPERNPCTGEGDEVPDFLDLDSDEDGLPDTLERLLGTDRLNPDTDEDGAVDSVEVCVDLDPLDPESRWAYEDFTYVILPYERVDYESLSLKFTVAGDGPQDITAIVEDLPDVFPEIDIALFVTSITPERGFPTSPYGFSSMDETTFYDVNPGTEVTFRMEFDNDIVPTEEWHICYHGWLVILGDGEREIGRLKFTVIVPKFSYSGPPIC